MKGQTERERRKEVTTPEWLWHCRRTGRWACLVATPAREPGAEPEPWRQTLSSTGRRSWASATLGAAAVANVEGGDRRGRGGMAGPPAGLPWRTQPDGHPLSSIT